jgi:hypothetical protein
MFSVDSLALRKYKKELRFSSFTFFMIRKAQMYANFFPCKSVP